MGDDLLFDYMFLKAQDKEKENERLREENDELIERMDSRRTDISDNEDIDEARFCWRFSEYCSKLLNWYGDILWRSWKSDKAMIYSRRLLWV